MPEQEPEHELAPYRPSDQELRSILGDARTIAVVGLSSNPRPASHDVAGYLKRRGYRIIPVNPNETEVFGEKAYPTLLDVPGKIDAVDVFRRPEEARRIAEEAGLDVVMGVCMKHTHKRLGV